MPETQAPSIGIFDSGLGGLSVWRQLVQAIPDTSVIYLADSANCPYGSKPTEQILDLSRRHTQFLMDRGCKMVVVACNTATAAAVDQLREEFDIPFIGMEPALKPAALNTQTGKVGILATEGTFKGRRFQEAREHYNQHVHITYEVGYGMVELVENGQTESPEALELLHRYIDPMLELGIDQLVLGCTHYPFLMPAMRKIVGHRVTLVEPAEAVASHAKNIWEEQNHPKVSAPEYHLYTNGSEDRMRAMLSGLESARGKNLEIYSLNQDE